MKNFEMQDVGIAATRFHRALRGAVEAALDPFRLSGGEYGALLFVDRNPGSSNADLARFLIVTPQALGRLTAGLEEKGLVQRRAEEATGRKRPLSLTAEGLDLLRRASPLVEEAQRVLLSPLDAAEQSAFLRALELCTTNADRPRKDLS